MTHNIIKFLTAGHVDDGKSTLIGKLLYDTDSIPDDQIASIKKLGNGEIDYSLFVEGLESERRQKITIDVAYRYFVHGNTKFIIADAPGHEQYTKNMAVAAANSNVAVILIDAVDGVKTQTIRHTYIAHLFGIKHFIIAINKMDLVGYSEEVFEQIKSDYLSKTKILGIENAYFIPISAINSDNIIKSLDNTNWYKGKSLLDTLSSIKIDDLYQDSLRFLVQNVIKHNDERLYQGKIVSGKINISDKVEVYPAKKTAIVKDVIKATENNLSIVLDHDIDIDRGSIFADNNIQFDNKLNAKIVWFSDKEFNSQFNNSLYIKISHNYIEAKISKVNYGVDIDTLSQNNIEVINQNSIADVQIHFSCNIVFDTFKDNKFTGSFLIIDKNDNETLAVGLIN